MAEVVQQALESMVDELEDYRRRGLFTEDEIKSIVKRRTAFEYSLKRRQPEKSDYLQYIEFELNLDALRRQRCERLHIKPQGCASAHSIIRRVHFIFQRAVRKHTGDVKLWLEYVSFCRRSGSVRQLSRTFGRVLQLHPRSVTLWISAADWEMRDNLNMTAARLLLQRALRFLSESTQLWIAYLRFELIFLHKYRVRQRAMGVNLTQTPQQQQKKTDTDLTVYDDDEDNDNNNTGASVVQPPRLEGEPEEKLTTFAAESGLDGITDGETPPNEGEWRKRAVQRFLAGELPRTVMLAALDEHGDNVALMQEMLNALREFPDNETLAQELLERIAQLPVAAAANPRVLLMLATQGRSERCPTNSVDAARVLVNQMVETALTSSAPEQQLDEEVFATLARFVQQPDQTEAVRRVCVEALERLWRGVREAERESTSACRLVVDTMASVGDAKSSKALLAITQAHVKRHARDEDAWLLHLQCLVQQQQQQSGGPKVGRAFEDALVALGNTHAGVWRLRLRHILRQETLSVTEVLALCDAQRIASLPSDAQVLFIDWCHKQLGQHDDGNDEDVQALVETVLRVCRQRPVALEVYVRATRLVGRALHCARATATQRTTDALRRLFEQSVTDYGRDSPSLWFSFFQWEQSQTDRDAQRRAARVHWRALKSLAHPDAFAELVAQ